MNKVSINILGSEYSLVSNKKKEEMLKIATIVIDEIEYIRSSNHALSKTDVAVLACNNIAEKYYDFVKSQQSTQSLEQKVVEQAKEIASLQLQLEQKDVKIKSLEMTDVSSRSLQAQIEKTKSECEDKIRNYQEVNDELQSEFYDMQMKIAKYEKELDDLRKIKSENEENKQD